jgi:hypothetical protein
MEESSTQYFPLGARLELGDGRVFHYVKAGGSALAAGKLVQAPATDANDDGGIAIASNAAVGDNSITITGPTGGLTANQYRDGFLVIDSGTNVGYVYRIDNHAAISAGASGVIYLKEEVKQALTAGTETVGLIKHPGDGVIVHPSPPTNPIVGVPVIDVTASYYFWAQTWGPAPVLLDDGGDVAVAGLPVKASDGIDGAVEPVTATYDTEDIVGVIMTDPGNGNYALVFLKLWP